MEANMPPFNPTIVPMSVATQQSGTLPPTQAPTPPVQPPPAGAVPVPPANAAQQTERTSGWENLFNSIRDNPDLQRFLLYTGAQMMQPIAPGQSTAGHIGAAVLGGVDYASASAAASREEARKNRALDIEQSNVDSQINTRKGQLDLAAEELGITADRLQLMRDQMGLDAEQFEKEFGIKKDEFALSMKKFGLQEKATEAEIKQGQERLKLDAQRIKLLEDELGIKKLESDRGYEIDLANLELSDRRVDAIWEDINNRKLDDTIKNQLAAELNDIKRLAGSVTVEGDLITGMVIVDSKTGKVLRTIRENPETNELEVIEGDSIGGTNEDDPLINHDPAAIWADWLESNPRATDAVRQQAITRIQQAHPNWSPPTE
jgi:transcriptional regulator with XRE-family HTH domain